VDRPPHELRSETHEKRGFRKFKTEVSENPGGLNRSMQHLVAKLPWSDNVRVLDRIKDRPTREWYRPVSLCRKADFRGTADKALEIWEIWHQLTSVT